ncbi:MAG: MATE family efflux transporter [Clostridia bacterium]|nr:MATE family efflux transporter [Clostridia bacterium]
MTKKRQSLLFSPKAIAAIIVPLFFQNLLAIAIGMADSMMVSNKGEAAFAGVSLVGSLDTVLIVLFSALTAGGSVVLAQAMGRDDREHACEAAKQMLYMTTGFATLIAAVVLILRVPLLRLLFGDVETGVMNNALAYFFFIALSFPFLAIENSVAATLRAQGDSMTSLKVSLLMNALNIGGNAILIYGLDLGAAGAAIATLLSRIVGAFIKIGIVLSKKRYIHIVKLLHYRPNGGIIRAILRIGVPNGIENCMFQFGRLMTSSLVSSLGTMAIAANAAALSLANLQYNTGAAVQSTMVAVVGRCVGAQEKQQAKYYVRLLLGIAYGAIIAVVLILCLFATPLLRLYGLSGETSELARQLLLYHGAVSVVLWPIGFCLPPAFRAANDVRFTMVVSTASMWAFRVVLGYAMALESVSVFGWFTSPSMGMGVMGVWIAMTVDWLCRSGLFLWRFVSGKWLSKCDALHPKSATNV